MIDPAVLLEELIAAGTPAKLIAKVAQLGAAVEALQRRRDADAKRQREYRKALNESRDVTLDNDSHVSARDVTPQHIYPHKSSKPKKASHICKHALPDDFALNEADIACARKAGWSDAKIASELARFRDHAHANGRKQADWHAAWRNWVTSPFQQTGPPRVNGHPAAAAPRPGSREDRAERTANALSQLRRHAGFGTDEPERSREARDDPAGFLPFSKPAGS